MFKRLLGLLAFALIAFATIAQTPDHYPSLHRYGQSFRFVVLADNRPGPMTVEQPEAYKRNIREINLLQPDFVIIVGDLIRGYTSDRRLIEAQWEEFDHVTGQFQMPYFQVVGNHDVWDEQSEQIYQQRYGKLFYSFSYKNAHFIMLNSEDQDSVNNIVGDQLEWLKKELETHQDKVIFVFLHKPLWAYRFSNWNAEVHPLLARYGVHTVFAGHWHLYRDLGERDGVRYIVTGGGGAPLDPGGFLKGGFFHFLHVTVQDTSVTIAVVKQGQIYPADVITQELIEKVKDLITFRPLAIEYDEQLRGKVVLTLNNIFDTPLRAKLQWHIPKDSPWRIEPLTAEMELSSAEKGLPPPLGGGPGQGNYVFELQGKTQHIFPKPTYSITISTPRGDYSASGKLEIDDARWVVRDWMVIGPFDMGSYHDQKPSGGFLTPFPPEMEIDFSRSYQGKGGKVSWKPFHLSSGRIVDFLRLFKPGTNVVAYAHTFVYSPQDMEVQVSFGSDDGARVWINGQLVLDRYVFRPVREDQDIFRIPLKRGWNSLLVKVIQGGGDWGFVLKLVDTKDLLKISASK